MISAFDPFNIKGKANKNNLLIFEIGSILEWVLPLDGTIKNFSNNKNARTFFTTRMFQFVFDNIYKTNIQIKTFSIF